MALQIINRTFTDDQNRTLNFPFFSGYDRVKAKYTIEIDFSFVISASNSVLKVGNSFTLQNGSNWEDYGFFTGAIITGDYENGSSHSIPANTTITFVDGATIHLSSNLAGGDGSYTIGMFTLKEFADAIGFDFNLVPNIGAGNEFSVIDGEAIRFIADVSGLAVNGTVVPSQLGNKSGASQISALIRRILDSGLNKRYEIEVNFNPWTVKDTSMYFSTACPKPWISIKAFPEFQNVALFLETINTPSDANIGLKNEVGNGGTSDYSLTYCNFEDGDGNTLPSIDYNQETFFEIKISGVFSASSKFNLVLFHDSQDETTFKNLPTNFDQNLFAIKNNSPLSIGVVGGNIASASRPDGAEISINNLEITQFSTYVILTGSFVPNSTFTTVFNNKNATDRAYNFWVRCENPNLNSNNIRPVWVEVSESNFSKAFISLGNYNIRNLGTFDHSFNLVQKRIKEDDIRSNFEFLLPTFNNDFQKITVGIKAKNTVTNEFFWLENFFADLTAIPMLPNGTKPVNLVQTRPFNLSPSNPNNVVKIIRKPANDIPNNYGVGIEYSYLARWEYWLQQLNTALAFYGNSTKDWFDYQITDWDVVLSLEIETADGNYINDYSAEIFNYDDWSGVTSVEFFREDGVTAITNPIIGENTHVKITFEHDDLTILSNKWAQMTVESFEQAPRWDLSSVWNWANVNQNPLKPLNGQTKLKVTSNVGSVVIEGLLDVSKLPNPTKISITGRLFSDEKIAINPDVRHKITVEPKKIPSGFDLSDRGETGNCCDCIYKVFADAENNDSYRNHVTSRWMIGETVTFELYKDGVLTAFVPTAQTFPNDTSAYYCTISWRDVLLTEGIGCYTLVGKSEVSGLEFEQSLGMFDLQQFTWERVDGLVCIRSVFNDANIQEQINFTNALVMDCLLLDGDIEEYQPTTEINNLIKANRIQEKVKRENRTKWTINVDFADFCHMKRLTDVHLLGENQLFISDYRKDAFDKTILDKPVILSESISLTPLYRSERQKGSFQVENKIVDAISRFGFVNASGEVNLSEIPLPNIAPIDVSINDIIVLEDITTNQNLNLVNQVGTELDFTQNGNTIEVDTVNCQDATVENSNQSYVQTVASGDTLILPDITYSVNNSNIGNLPSVLDFNIELSDINGEVTPESITASGTDISIVLKYCPLAETITEMFEGRVIFDNGIFEAETCLINTLKNELI